MMNINPLPDPDERNSASRDEFDLAKGGLPLSRLERFLSDSDEFSAWRAKADKCCDYYDGEQLTPQQVHDAIKDGLDPRVSNLIRPVVNSMLGQEAKTRRDPRLEPDEDESADMADYFSCRLKEAQRETNADMSISNAYASQVKAGIGWVEVSRNADPFGYQYRVEDRHRANMRWDKRAKHIGLADARWLVRSEYKDVDEVIAAWPEHKEILLNATDNWASWAQNDFIGEDHYLNRAMETDRRFGISRAEWIDGYRKRIRLYEVWYRVPAEVVTMRAGPRWVVYDETRPAHVEALARGLVKVRRAVTMQVRKAIFAGPYRLLDEGTKLKRFPYVPFFGFRTDKDLSPYGMVHSMLSPQDDYNERYMRVQFMLKAQQLIVENDALDEEYNTIKDIEDTRMRPDMVAVVKRDRIGGLLFKNDLKLQPEQFEFMQNAKRLIEETSGVYSAQLGNAPTGVTSGLAINSLVEQGLMAMGELNDNYAFSRRMVYEMLLDLIFEDHAERDMQVKVGSGQARRVIVLNTIDPQTKEPVNMVKEAAVKVGLAEVPASPAYQMQMSQMMGDMIRALAGNPASGVLVPAWIEQTSAFGENRKQLADDARRITGLPTSGDRQGAQQWQQQQQQQAARTAALNEQAVKTKLAGEQATAELTNARTALTNEQAIKTSLEAAQMHQAANEIDLIQQALQEAMAA